MKKKRKLTFQLCARWSHKRNKLECCSTALSSCFLFLSSRRNDIFTWFCTLLSPSTESKNFLVIHCTGYLKSWSTAKIGLEDDNETDNDSSSLSCLVAVGRVQRCASHHPPDESGHHIKVRPLEYMSRHSIDGKFSYVDERSVVVDCSVMFNLFSPCWQKPWLIKKIITSDFRK